MKIIKALAINSDQTLTRCELAKDGDLYLARSSRYVRDESRKTVICGWSGFNGNAIALVNIDDPDKTPTHWIPA